MGKFSASQPLRRICLIVGFQSISVKLRRGTTKWVVKEVARRYLPDEVVDRRKVGFTVPLDRWFRGGLRDLAWDMLMSENSLVGSIMSRGPVRELLERHDRGQRMEHMRLWTLLGLEVWHDVFFTGGGRRPSGGSAAGSPLRTVS